MISFLRAAQDTYARYVTYRLDRGRARPMGSPGARSRTLGTESRAEVVTAVTLPADTTEVVIPARSAPKRTQAERSEATRSQLVRTARDLFAADGYTPTSLDAVCRKAGVTKG